MMFKPIRKIVLASASPRRSELLGKFINGFSVEPSNVDETIDENISPTDAAVSIALRKAEKCAQIRFDDAFIIAADTVVAHGGRLYEKPVTADNARKFLTELRGKLHQVVTGVCLIDKANGNQTIFSETTVVKFTDFNDKIMEKYIKSKEGLDRAGGYAIQGMGSIFVEKIAGDYSNVVGLPIGKLISSLLDKNVIEFM